MILAAYTLALCEIARFAKMHVFDEIIACDKRWYKFSSQGNTFVRSWLLVAVTVRQWYIFFAAANLDFQACLLTILCGAVDIQSHKRRHSARLGAICGDNVIRKLPSSGYVTYFRVRLIKNLMKLLHVRIIFLTGISYIVVHMKITGFVEWVSMSITTTCRDTREHDSR